MMFMGKIKICIGTCGKKGMGDEVSDTFAKANTLTLASIDGNRAHLDVLDNPAKNMSSGRGRTIVPFIKSHGVKVVVASEFGLGAIALLEKAKIRMVVVPPGTKVDDIIRDGLYKLKKLKPRSPAL